MRKLLGISFNERGIAKVAFGVAKGERKADERANEKAPDWQRRKARVMRREASGRGGLHARAVIARPPRIAARSDAPDHVLRLV